MRLTGRKAFWPPRPILAVVPATWPEMSNETDPFRALYDGHHPQVRRLLSRMVGESEADDLTQIVFLKVSKALPRFRTASTPSTWLHRIAVNVACDWWRSRAGRVAKAASSPHGGATSADGRPAADAVPDPGLSPEGTLAREQAAAFIRAEIGRLPRPYRDVLMLHDIAGLTDEDTAATLSVTVGHAKVRLHRARQALKAAVGARCEAFRAELSCQPTSPACCRPAEPAPAGAPRDR
jgi:RNA polymerase sigma-70 factor, ECF subfamily